MHHVVELRRFVRLPRRECDGEDKAVAVSNQVELAPLSAAAAAQSVVVGLEAVGLVLFLRAPAAARDARTLVPSTSHRSQSILP